MKALVNTSLSSYLLQHLRTILDLLPFSELPQMLLAQFLHQLAHFVPGIISDEILRVEVVREVVLLRALLLVNLAQLLRNAVEVDHVVALILRELPH